MAGVAGTIRGVASMRHRISILRRDTDQNSLGQATDSFASVASGVPARVVELSGRELERARQMVAEATHSVELRVSSIDVTPKDRVQFGSLVLTVGAAQTDETSMMQTLTCYEVKR